jgi:hypothetical protein
MIVIQPMSSAPSLSRSQTQRCLKAMDELEKYHISSLFSRPVDPVHDRCPNYFQIIHHPMDLGTARRKLESGEYSTVEQWKSDIDLVWTNTVTFSGNKSLLTVLAKQLQTVFRDITACLSSDADADWLAEFEKIKSDMNALVRASPKVAGLSRTGRKSIAGRSLSSPASPRIASKQAENKLGLDEIAKLASDVNRIDDPVQIDQVITLIKQFEPNYQMNDDDDEVELDINNLEQPTLVALRELVSRLLED